MSRWRLGYVPLLDAAVLIAAVERGFTAEAGLAVELVAQPSWATLRDEVALGHLDGAHMLAPLAVAASGGASGPRTDLAAVFALNLNGNAITVSTGLWAAMASAGAGDDAASAARAFVAVGRARAAAGRPLVLATVFPFSCHTYQLRRFAELGGGVLEEIAELVVVPPPQSAEALGAGVVDGICVGAPWNSVAVAAGTGCIAAFGCDLSPDCVEKVLAVRRERLAQAAPLVSALARAAAWCGTPANRPSLARMMGRADRAGADAAIVLSILEGRLRLRRDIAERRAPDYLRFPPGGYLSAAQAQWLGEAMERDGQLASLAPEAVGTVLRPVLRPPGM